MSALFWLLLPASAAAGWWAARYRARRERERSASTTPAYFRGLNYLLNEEPDKAIDVFVQLLEVDSETVETHLALGSLFRRRGEVERAIRIHQNLVARPSLEIEQRAGALLELGMDYMRAGLYDRAENLFLELREMKFHVRRALQNLLVIYQQERDWKACLEVSGELERLTGESLALPRSHYYCELAEAALRRGDEGQAARLLASAIEARPGCARAVHLQARMAMKIGDFRKAIKLLQATVEQMPDYLPEVLGDLKRCYHELDDPAGLRCYLRGFLDGGADVAVMLALADLLVEQEGEAAASAFLADQVAIRPTIRGVLRLIELNAGLSDKRASQLLAGLRGHMERLLAERPAYQCIRCGYGATTMHWQCPSCRSWSTIRRKPEPEDR